MKTTPRMQGVITRLIEKHESEFRHWGDERCLHLELAGFAPLLIVVNELTVCVVHEEMEDGAVNAWPEVVFYTGGKRWVPIHANGIDGKEQSYALLNWKQGGIIPLKEAASQQVEEARRCEAWALDLQHQGWLEHASQPQ
ncbi:hypothetical protein IAD21_06027 [Abditibacteriota bacterium]|nr:hypothetical protein IAD21_06027 [Abditibacteriota bacterium]